MYKAIDLYLGNPSRDWSKELLALYNARSDRAASARRERDAGRIKGTKPSLVLSKYAGVYEDPLFGRITIVDQGGKLRIDAGPHLKGKLEHWQYDRFRASWDDRWQGTDILAFTIGDGVPTALEIGGFTLKRIRDAGAGATN
jgi:hypothetical protein